MKLYTRCKNCKSEISFTSDVNDRPELEMRKGKEFLMTCNSCHQKHTYHVNDFTASKSLLQKITALSISLILIIALILGELYVLSMNIYFYGAVFLVPSLAYLIINKQQVARLNSFNRYKVKQ